MKAIEDYLQGHYAGACAGVDLFARSARGQSDPEVADVLRELYEQVDADRQELLEIMTDLGITPNLLLTLAARAGERVGRLKPNGSLLHRTPTTDLVEVEALHDAVASKAAGWEALLAVVDDVPELDRARLELLRDGARSQLERLNDVHALVARRALGNGR